MPSFNRVSIQGEITKYLSPHETLLSFYDDDGNIAFIEWWESTGSELFNEWCSTNQDYKHIAAKG